MRPPGRGDDTIAKLGEDRNRNRANAARRARNRDRPFIRRHTVILQRQDAQHRRIAGRADRHGFGLGEDIGALHQPLARHPRPLRISAVVPFGRAKAVEDHIVTRLETGVARGRHRACKVYPRDQRQALQWNAAGEDKAVLVVDG